MFDLKKWIAKVTDALKVDFVVEQGTDGIWTYRKWNSGIAECWGREATSRTMSITAGYGYSYYTSPALTIALPTGLFTSIPIMSVTLENTDDVRPSVFINNTTQFRFYVYAPASGNHTFTVSAYARGRWK